MLIFIAKELVLHFSKLTINSQTLWFIKSLLVNETICCSSDAVSKPYAGRL